MSITYRLIRGNLAWAGCRGDRPSKSFPAASISAYISSFGVGCFFK